MRARKAARARFRNRRVPFPLDRRSAESEERLSKKRKKEMPSTHISGDDPKKEKKKQRRGRRQKSHLERFPSSFALLRYASLLAQGPLAPADAAQVRFVLLGLGLQKTPRRQRWKPPK